jgi:hypothetical protein
MLNPQKNSAIRASEMTLFQELVKVYYINSQQSIVDSPQKSFPAPSPLCVSPEGGKIQEGCNYK